MPRQPRKGFGSGAVSYTHLVRLAQEARLLNNPPPFPLNIDETNHVMAFHRGGLLFVFNWSGDKAIMAVSYTHLYGSTGRMFL